MKISSRVNITIGVIMSTDTSISYIACTVFIVLTALSYRHFSTSICTAILAPLRKAHYICTMYIPSMYISTYVVLCENHSHFFLFFISHLIVLVALFIPFDDFD